MAVGNRVLSNEETRRLETAATQTMSASADEETRRLETAATQTMSASAD